MADLRIYTLSQLADTASIRSALADLYRNVAAAEGNVVPVVRPTLFNLVVHAADPDRLAEVETVVKEVVARLPARTVIVDPSRGSSAGYKAEIALVCSIDNRGERRLCGDFARLATAGLGSEVAGLVTPLLEGDVPTYLWIADKLATCDDQLTTLFALAEYVVINSRNYNCLTDALASVSRYGQGAGVLDICWASLLPWREAIAQHFDPPGTRVFLNTVTEIEVLFEPLANTLLPSAPLLLGSWLAERLGAEIDKASWAKDGLVASLRCDTKVFGMRVTECGCQVEPGEPVAVTIRSSDVEFATSRQDAECARVQSLGGTDGQIRTVGASSLEEHARLIAYLLRNPSDPVYVKASNFAATLVAHANLSR